MPKLKSTSFGSFLRNNKLSIVAGIASGLYPIIFYYTNNYSLINSVKHLAFFIGLFVVCPMVIFLVADRISKLTIFSRWRNFVLPFLNVFTFLLFLQLCLLASLQIVVSIGIFIGALIISFFFHKHLKKIIAIELLLAVIAFFWLILMVVRQLNYSDDWMLQPDNIEQAVFKKKPNIYFIQPDGYVNFSELNKGYYKFDNSDFESFLTEKKFKFYEGFRNNYSTTLVSNTSIFMMKHHFYKMDATASGEPIDSRKIIVSENSVLNVFKKNDYKTFLISEKPYFLANRPKVGYDTSNFSSDDISLLTTGMEDYADVVVPLKKYIVENSETNNFFFVQIFKPGHITNALYDSEGVRGEREIYIEELVGSNSKLVRIINTILQHDSEAMIVIMSDHGGYVGFGHTKDSLKKTVDRDLIYSIFSSVLAIHWPNNKAPKIDKNFKSSVNLFRILFSYLSENENYLKHLEDDASYIQIREVMIRGTYQYIDAEGKITFKQHIGY